MSEDEHAPTADDHSAENHTADANGHIVAARLAQLERAFGEQSARLRAIEQRLGLVDDTTRPRPFASAVWFSAEWSSAVGACSSSDIKIVPRLKP